ncbi:MAG: ribosome-associated translation inhibitor RaiA [Acidobacteria bacterium]|nr:ribosome-associated translation inhibitor RaiA [Acidobacteriota bacterium]
MKVQYSGKQTKFNETQAQKIEGRFDKLSRLVDGREEGGIHVFLHPEGHSNKAEVTVHFHGHEVVGIAAGHDAFAAVLEAVEKADRQIHKLKEKWRASRRSLPEVAAEPEPSGSGDPGGVRVFRVSTASRKPMTLDEALLELDGASGYVAFRDEKNGRLHVLVRRADGHLDLVE